MLRTKNQLLFLFCFIFFQATSQNLVPNPSFENTNALPCSYIDYASQFNAAISNWVMPTAGTSDLFSTLTPQSCVLSPFSTQSYAQGYQLPRTGTTMAGFYAYGSYGITDYREYLEVELISPLEIGTTYYVEMYVSTSNLMRYGVNNIGMYFSTDMIDAPSTYTTLYYTPQVIDNTVITDTLNWVKISGTFTATEADKYLTIGNFYDDTATVFQIKNDNFNSVGAYYFIDDILVKPTITCRENDSSIVLCKGNSTTLGSTKRIIISWALASSPNTIISNDPTLTVSPQNTTRYIATYSCGQKSIFEVIVPDPIYRLGNDTTLCSGQTISFNATTPNANYVWQDGSTNHSYVANATGTYSVTITNNCFSIHDEIFINVLTPPAFSLGNDTTLCLGQTISFDATTDYATYVWQDGSTNPLYVATRTGTYSVTIANDCFNRYDEIFIKILAPPTFSFGNDTTICLGHTISFDATTEAATYLWQNGSTNNTYTAEDPGYYSVLIKNSCGTLNENITLNLCCPGANIPNLITPNGDGMNETFNIDCFGNGDYELSVYNIWGALIYENKAYLNNWDGEQVSDGIYYYVIRYKNNSINNGWVQVLR